MREEEKLQNMINNRIHFQVHKPAYKDFFWNKAKKCLVNKKYLVVYLK